MRRTCLHLLLILMMLASGIAAAAQNVLHMDASAGTSHEHRNDGWHAHDHAHHDLHHALVIEGDSNEHGDHIHVHVPLCAVLAADIFDVLPLKPTILLPHIAQATPSLTYAPPVPPPNA